MTDSAYQHRLDQLCAALSPEARRSIRTVDDALHEACIEGLSDLAASLGSELGVDANAVGYDGILPLYRAALHGHHAVCRVLVMELGAKVHAVNIKEGSTALHIAAEMGHKETVRVLISELGANINAKRRLDGRTALHIAAAEFDSFDVAQVLVTYGANVGATCYKGMTPLCYAVDFLNDAVVRALVEDWGADVDARSDCGGTALHYAARSDSRELLRMLAGVMGPSASDVRCADGRTPLHWAAMTGADAAVRVLICELGADLMAVDANGFAALHHAAHGGYRETATLLIGFCETLDSAALNVATFGRLHTPLHLAVLSRDSELVRYLVRAGAEVGAKDSDGWTALHYAAAYCPEIVRDFVRDFGSCASATTNDGRTAFSIADQKDAEERDPQLRASENEPCTPFAKAAIVLKMSVALEDAKKNSGWTALHRAAFEGDFDMVDTLCMRGASAKTRDFDGRNPLHLAAIGGHAGVLGPLCEGASNDHVDERDRDGRTPLYYADAWGHHEVSRTLVREHGADLNLGGPISSRSN